MVKVAEPKPFYFPATHSRRKGQRCRVWSDRMWDRIRCRREKSDGFFVRQCIREIALHHAQWFVAMPNALPQFR